MKPGNKEIVPDATITLLMIVEGIQITSVRLMGIDDIRLLRIFILQNTFDYCSETCC